jgi:hypothetical protein
VLGCAWLSDGVVVAWLALTSPAVLLVVLADWSGVVVLGAAAVVDDALWSGVVVVAEELGAAALLDGVVAAVELLCVELMLPEAAAL